MIIEFDDEELERLYDDDYESFCQTKDYQETSAYMKSNYGYEYFRDQYEENDPMEDHFD